MKKLAVLACALTFLLALSATAVVAGERTSDPLGVSVSPQTLILSQTQGGRVTVHTDIPASTVNSSTLALNGVPVAGVGIDTQGDIVALFDEQAVEAIIAPPGAVLTLTGEYRDGTPFSGSDTVRVVP